MRQPLAVLSLGIASKKCLQTAFVHEGETHTLNRQKNRAMLFLLNVSDKNCPYGRFQNNKCPRNQVYKRMNSPTHPQLNHRIVLLGVFRDFFFYLFLRFSPHRQFLSEKLLKNLLCLRNFAFCLRNSSSWTNLVWGFPANTIMYNYCPKRCRAAPPACNSSLRQVNHYICITKTM